MFEALKKLVTGQKSGHSCRRAMAKRSCRTLCRLLEGVSSSLPRGSHTNQRLQAMGGRAAWKSCRLHASLPSPRKQMNPTRSQH